MPRASWDFELGDLRGWTLTGTAFNNQPTLGDNTYARSNYGENLVTGFNAPTADWLRSPIITFHGDSGRHIGAQGVYWVGTYENRRTDGTAAGEVQGDAPVGTMTSPPFIIGGVTLDTATGERGDHATTASLQIGFLVGGGCRAKETYVELLVDGEDDPLSAMRTAAQSASGQGATSTASKAGVDAAGYTNGMSVLRATGRCEEAMRRVWWNVTSFSGRSARLRIVDSSKTHWGHINFDDVLFSWHGPGLAMQGGLGMSAGASDLGTGQTGSAGAAYAFRRKSAGASEELCACTCTGTGCACDGAKWSCDWQEQSKLQASDKRSGDLFGFAVDVDDASGVVVIGAPGRSGTDQVRAPSLLLCTLRLRFHLHPFAAALQRTLTRPSFSFPSRRPPARRQFNYNSARSHRDLTYTESGGVYVFTRISATRDGLGAIQQPPQWSRARTDAGTNQNLQVSLEQMLLQDNSGKQNRRRLGTDVSVQGCVPTTTASPYMRGAPRSLPPPHSSPPLLLQVHTPRRRAGRIARRAVRRRPCWEAAVDGRPRNGWRRRHRHGGAAHQLLAERVQRRGEHAERVLYRYARPRPAIRCDGGHRSRCDDRPHRNRCVAIRG